MSRKDLYEFLAGQKLAVLGSVAADGTPQSALVGIAVTEDLEIVFDTVKSTRKYQNLAAKSDASFVIGCSGEITVQYEGVATELQGDELAQYQPLYFQAWPDGPSRLSWEGITYFVVRPRWIRYSDFSQTPPSIVVFECHAFRQLTPYGRVK